MSCDESSNKFGQLFRHIKWIYFPGNTFGNLDDICPISSIENSENYY